MTFSDVLPPFHTNLIPKIILNIHFFKMSSPLNKMIWHILLPYSIFIIIIDRNSYVLFLQKITAAIHLKFWTNLIIEKNYSYFLYSLF